ncbi:MAG: hypothetical protein M3450_01785 [Actinomycetota bacterium]|nr:hypothetical protein [Actinomycetota bacterium]
MPGDVGMSVDIALDQLPLVLPQQLGGLRIVLLRRQNSEDDSWDLDYAAIGLETRNLWVEARDEGGNEYTVTTSWNADDGELVYGTYTFAPGLADEVGSLRFIFSLEDSQAVSTSQHEELTPERVAAHWVERLDAQLVGWAQRNSLVEAVISASTRHEAIERLTAPPFGLSDAQARHVLDLSLGRLTAEGQHELIEDLESARGHLEG